jgi:hypothetical protein
MKSWNSCSLTLYFISSQLHSPGVYNGALPLNSAKPVYLKIHDLLCQPASVGV